MREREKAEDMPDVDGGSEGGTTLSQTTEDPEADYFFRTDLYDFPYKEFLAKVRAFRRSIGLDGNLVLISCIFCFFAAHSLMLCFL